MTIDEAIAELKRIRELELLGGGTVGGAAPLVIRDHFPEAKNLPVEFCYGGDGCVYVEDVIEEVV
jgi:hypothetical protein